MGALKSKENRREKIDDISPESLIDSSCSSIVEILFYIMFLLGLLSFRRRIEEAQERTLQ